MKIRLIIAFLVSGGLFQACTQSRGQSATIPHVVTVKHKALRHDEIKQRIALGYGTNYRLESAVTSCTGDDCLTTLVFVFAK